MAKLSARDQQGDLVLDADVVVVGSGAGGSVVATELAETGLRVLVLEEGPHVSPEEHGAMRPSESIRHLWRDGAMSMAVGVGNSPTINVHMGRCVGGSSLHTGGVCFRLPEAVHHHWSKDLGLSGYSERAMREVFDHVEKRIHVETVPKTLWSRSAELFAEGAERCGIEMKQVRRNTDGCQGAGRCNFGCPHKAKMSVDHSYLPRAVDQGVDVWSHCLVERIIVKGNRAVGVEGRILNGERGEKKGKLTVHARTVVLTAGAWHNPVIMKRSGLSKGNRWVGRNMTLHPSFRTFARFDEDVRGWQGALQANYTDHFEKQGITLIDLFIPPGILAAQMHGVGREQAENAKQIPNLAVFGGMIHDHGGGTVHTVPGRDPLVTYRMDKRDRAKVPLMLRSLAEVFFAAGAREVMLPVVGLGPVTADALAQTPLEKMPAFRFECGSMHPLGSCQMGAFPTESAVDPDGRPWNVDGLVLADSSVIPTSLGVNPQLTIMSVATRLAWRLRERLERRASPQAA